MGMSQRPVLAHGQPARLGSGGDGAVGELIGSGGQGSVYAFELAGRRLALKWYHPQVALADTGLRARIARMIRLGPPDDNFLWPIDLVEVSGSPSFGYAMPMMSGDRRPLKDLFAAPPRGINPGLDVRAAACFAIASSFQKLHATGYCYQDINFGGFFIDPERGSIQICDADNIAVDGEPGGVYGTRKFMAPEVVRREAMPSIKTDLYSMAVLFFYILFNWHPLDGKREAEIAIMDQAAELRLYGQDPCFLFDPVSQANGPVAGVHDWIVARWRAMPEGMRDLFVRAFTTGLSQPRDGRPVESEWRNALARLRDGVVRCPTCRFEHAVDRQRIGAPACVACGSALSLPAMLSIGRDVVLLGPRNKVLAYQIAGGAVAGDDAPVAVVTSHPSDPAILGMQNVGTQTWSIHTPDGKTATVAPGRTLRIADGIAIDFGSRRGTMAVPARAATAATLGTAA